jgi:hypothetical protein
MDLDPDFQAPVAALIIASAEVAEPSSPNNNHQLSTQAAAICGDPTALKFTFLHFPLLDITTRDHRPGHDCSDLASDRRFAAIQCQRNPHGQTAERHCYAAGGGPRHLLGPRPGCSLLTVRNTSTHTHSPTLTPGAEVHSWTRILVVHGIPS